MQFRLWRAAAFVSFPIHLLRLLFRLSVCLSVCNARGLWVNRVCWHYTTHYARPGIWLGSGRNGSDSLRLEFKVWTQNDEQSVEDLKLPDQLFFISKLYHVASGLRTAKRTTLETLAQLTRSICHRRNKLADVMPPTVGGDGRPGGRIVLAVYKRSSAWHYPSILHNVTSENTAYSWTNNVANERPTTVEKSVKWT